MRSIFFVCLVLGAVAVAAIRLLPWWGLAALLAGAVLSVLVLIKWGLPRLLKAPFRAKGAVLRGATVRVHSVERAEAPAAAPDDEDEATAGEPREHYRVDVTVTPRPPTGAFSLWAPSELVLVGPDARAEEPEADETAGEVRAVDVEQEGRFEPDGGMKYGGPQRLRLLVAVPPEQRRLRFRYYFEVFGDVALPAPAAAMNGRPLAGVR